MRIFLVLALATIAAGCSESARPSTSAAPVAGGEEVVKFDLKGFDS